MGMALVRSRGCYDRMGNDGREWAELKLKTWRTKG